MMTPIRGYLVLGSERRNRKRQPYGPIIIVRGLAFINVVGGRASQRQPLPPPRGAYPKPVPCKHCGESFMGNSGSSAYCNRDCQRAYHAAWQVAAELAAMRRGRSGRDRGSDSKSTGTP